MLGESKSAPVGSFGSFSTPLKWISARLLTVPLLPLSTCASCIFAGILVRASISTRRVAATGSARYSRPETWTVIVNLRRTNSLVIRLAIFVDSRTTACLFAAAFFGVAFLGTAFFGAALLGGRLLWGCFWGT